MVVGGVRVLRVEVIALTTTSSSLPPPASKRHHKSARWLPFPQSQNYVRPSHTRTFHASPRLHPPTQLAKKTSYTFSLPFYKWPLWSRCGGDQDARFWIGFSGNFVSFYTRFMARLLIKAVSYVRFLRGGYPYQSERDVVRKVFISCLLDWS